MKNYNSFLLYTFLVMTDNTVHMSQHRIDINESELEIHPEQIPSKPKKYLFRLLQISMMIHFLNTIFTTFNILISMKILFTDNSNNTTRLLTTISMNDVSSNKSKINEFIKNITSFFTSWQKKYILKDSNGFFCTADNKSYPIPNITFTFNCKATNLTCNVSSGLPNLDKAVVNCTETNSTNIAVMSLQGQVKGLTDMVNTDQGLITNLTMTINMLSKNNTLLQQTIVYLNQTVNSLTTENQILSQQVKNLETVNMNLTAQVQNLTITNQNLLNQVGNLTEANKNLIAKINELNINTTSLKQTIFFLNQTVNSLTTENQILSEQILNLEHDNQNLTMQIQSLTKINQNLTNQVATLTQNNTNLYQQLQAAQDEINRMNGMNNFLAYTQSFSYFTLAGYLIPIFVILMLNSFMLKQNKFSFSDDKQVNRYMMYNVLIFCIDMFFIITCLFFDGFEFSLRLIINMSITILNALFNITTLKCHKK